MPPKGVDKARQKEKEKIAEDKTFGMKNKNKSKVVQKYIKSITSSMTGAPKGGKEEQQRLERDAKQKDLAKAALLNSLFNQSTDKKGRAYDPIAKKAAKQQEEEAIAAGKKLDDETRKAIIEGIANTIRLTNPKGIRMSELGAHPIIHALKDKHADTFKILSMLLFIKANDKTFWVDDADSSNPMLRCQADVDAETAPDDRPIEEIIEERRAALPPGGTPVTLETFKAWTQKREADRLAEVEAQIKDQKKAGGKLVGLSGRDLFTFDASLFVDDEGAASGGEYDERSEVEDDDEDEAAGRTAGIAPDEGEDDDEGSGPDEEAIPEGDTGARGSAEVAINENLFLEGGDLPDDLDDLDDDDEDGK